MKQAWIAIGFLLLPGLLVGVDIHTNEEHNATNGTAYHFLTSPGTAHLDTNSSVTLGAITTADNGSGILNLSHATTTSAVGNNTNEVGSLNITASTTTMGGNLHATTTTVSSGATINTDGYILDSQLFLGGTNGELNVNGTGASVTGTINGSAADQGVLRISENYTTGNSVGGTNALKAVDIESGKTLTMAHNVRATTTTVGDGSTLNLGSNTLSGNVVLEGNSGELNINAAGGSVAGTIDGVSDGKGVLRLSENFTTGGVVGANHALKSIDVESGKSFTMAHDVSAVTTTVTNGATMNTGSNNTYSGNVVLDSTGTLNISGASTSLNGTIKGSGNNHGTLKVSANFTSGGDIGDATHALSNLDVESGATFIMDHNVFANATAIKNGAKIQTGTKTLTGDVTLDASGELDINGAGGGVSGTIRGSANNRGTLRVSKEYTTQNEVGGGGFALASVAVEDGQTFILDHQVFANATTVKNGAKIQTKTHTLTGDINLTSDTSEIEINGVGGTVSGRIDGASDHKGLLDIQENFTTGGIIGGTHALKDINVSNAKTLTMEHNVSAETTTLQQNARLITNTHTLTSNLLLVGDHSQVDVNGTINGTIDGGSPHKGIVNIVADTTTGGAIGATHAVRELNVTSGHTFILDHNVFAQATAIKNGAVIQANDHNLTSTVTLDQNARLEIDGDGDVLGLIDGSSAGRGSLKINRDYTTNSAIGSNYSLNDINITAGHTLAVAHDINATSILLSNANVNSKIQTQAATTITGHIKQSGTSGLGLLDIDHDTNVTGGIGQSSQRLDVAIAHGKQLRSGGTIFADALVVDGSGYITTHDHNVTANSFTTAIESGKRFTNGETRTYIDAGSGTIAINTINQIPDTTIMDYTLSNDSGNNKLQLSANYKSAQTLGLSGNNARAWAQADHPIDSDNALYDAFHALSSTAAVNDALSTMTPEHEGAMRGTYHLSDRSGDTLSAHLQVSRSEGMRGVSYGGNFLDSTLWAQPFISREEQENQGEHAGYDSTGKGMLFGIDRYLDNGGLTYGFALSRAHASVQGKGLNRSSTSVHSLGGSAYVSQEYANRYFIDGIVSYSKSHNHAARRIAVGDLERTASASFKSSNLGMRVNVGQVIQTAGGLTLTPQGSFKYNAIDMESYRESGAGVLNLLVDNSSVDRFETQARVALSQKMRLYNGGLFVPEIEGGVSYAMGDDYTTNRATFEGGGEAFTTYGLDSDNITAILGLGASYVSVDNALEFKLDYDAKVRSGFRSHLGVLSAKRRF
jgi:outer membrane autotransporter protein